MQIPQENLLEIDRFLREHHVPQDNQDKRFHFYCDLMERFGRPLTSESRVLEVGTGTGWLLVMFTVKGLQSEGLEISQQLIDNARRLGRERGVEPDIRLGNIEDVDLGEGKYDFIIASSVFEHVQHWERALGIIARALRPGGLFYFASTNKLSFTSGEYNFPLYGWLPDALRFKLRIWRQGADIMKLGIDFNQFRPGQLRKAFRAAGFTQALDIFEYTNVDAMRSPFKRALARVIRVSRVAHFLAATFIYGNMFLCIK